MFRLNHGRLNQASPNQGGLNQGRSRHVEMNLRPPILHWMIRPL
jgi:hypothetical protein